MRASDSRFARYAHIIIPPPPHTHLTHRGAVLLALRAWLWSSFAPYMALGTPVLHLGIGSPRMWCRCARAASDPYPRSCVCQLGVLICILRGVPSCTRLSVDPSNGAGCHGSKESPSLKLIADQVVHAAQRQSPSTLGPFGGNSMALVRRMSSSLRSAWSPSRQCSSAEQSPSASHKTMMSHQSK